MDALYKKYGPHGDNIRELDNQQKILLLAINDLQKRIDAAQGTDKYELESEMTNMFCLFTEFSFKIAQHPDYYELIRAK